MLVILKELASDYFQNKKVFQNSNCAIFLDLPKQTSAHFHHFPAYPLSDTKTHDVPRSVFQKTQRLSLGILKYWHQIISETKTFFKILTVPCSWSNPGLHQL